MLTLLNEKFKMIILRAALWLACTVLYALNLLSPVVIWSHSLGSFHLWEDPIR